MLFDVHPDATVCELQWQREGKFAEEFVISFHDRVDFEKEAGGDLDSHDRKRGAHYGFAFSTISQRNGDGSEPCSRKKPQRLSNSIQKQTVDSRKLRASFSCLLETVYLTEPWTATTRSAEYVTVQGNLWRSVQKSDSLLEDVLHLVWKD